MWTTETAAKFIRSIHPTAFAAGWNVHLGGSVLTRGFSKSDLDVLLMPRFQEQRHSIGPLIYYLRQNGWVWRKRTVLPHRDVYLATKGKRWVELIFVRIPS